MRVSELTYTNYLVISISKLHQKIDPHVTTLLQVLESGRHLPAYTFRSVGA